MSTTAIRTTKVQALRPPDPEPADKTSGPSYLARAVSLHLAGKRDEALSQLQRAVAANQASAEIYRAMAHIQFEMGDFKEAGKSYRILTQVKPQYAMGWFNLAVCLERQGGWDDASEAFHKASTLDPKHLDAHLGLGVSHLRLEDPKSALFSFERLELSPDHEDALFGKAAALQSLGHMDDAAKLYQRILDHDPESEESLSNLILIGMSKEDFDMVREYAERLLELHPESTVALEGLAAWASAAGEHALTAKFCTLLVSAVPGHFEGWFNLALSHQKSGRWQQAIEAYEEAIKQRTQSSEAYTNLGIVREQIGDLHGARTAYDRAIQANPEALAPLWNVALLLEHSKQNEEAERWYKMVLEKAPKEEEARFRLGYLRLQREDFRGAIEAFEGCLRYRQQWPEAYANLALAYTGIGDRDRAERLYEKMLEGDPKSMDALRGLASLAIQASDFDTALELHVRLIDLGERTAEVLYNAGLMYEKAGQIDKAVRLYKDALAQKSDMPEALLNLGRNLEAAGKSDEARNCWSKALEAEPALAQGYFGPAID